MERSKVIEKQKNGESPFALSVRNLRTRFLSEGKYICAVDGVNFDLKNGETLGVVGESGCGKSVTSLSVLRLLASPPNTIVEGEIVLGQMDLNKKSQAEMQAVRGKEIAMIFQEPMTSLNPVFTVGDQIFEAIRAHQKISKEDAYQRVLELLKQVGISSPERRYHEYPHQLSGGMRQRIMIAMAISCDPTVLIADEPTTALDVTIQAQILDLLKTIQSKRRMSVMLITHDLGIVREFSQRVMVMYAGQIVEMGSTEDVFVNPKHPYTEALLRSIPKLGGSEEELYTIPGMVPKLGDLKTGCRFQDRCRYVSQRCRDEAPELKNSCENNDHLYRCIR